MDKYGIKIVEEEIKIKEMDLRACTLSGQFLDRQTQLETEIEQLHIILADLESML